MRIAYCLPSLYIPGGMERVLTLKVNYFADTLGYEIFIILTDGKEKSPYFNLSPKVKVINLDINYDETFGKKFIQRAIKYRIKQFIFKKRLTKCLFHIKPDITVSMLRREIIFINSIKDGSIKIGELHVSRPNMHDAFGKDMNIVKKIVANYWEKQLIKSLKKLKMFIVLTNEDAKNWPEITNIVAIPNPLPFYPARTSECITKEVIAVGRYQPIKGFDLLIDAWKIVSEQYPDWILRIYGNGNRAPLVQQLQQLKLERTCILEPPVSNITSKYLESSIFVLSSRYEGFGMAIAEAMVCGVPPVSFACPCGPRELIKDNEDGFLVENGNTKALAKKINYLIEHEDIRKRMGESARQNIARLQIDKIVIQWKELFESLSGVE